MVRLDREEKELLDSFERGEWHSVEGREAEFERYREYARATFKKDRRVNIRLSRKDLETIQKRALEEGIHYQTLMAGVIKSGWNLGEVYKARKRWQSPL